MDSVEEKKLNECLNGIIQKVDTVITKLNSKNEISSQLTTQSTTDSLFNNSIQNNNINTFTVDINEEELLDTLKDDIENILKDSLPQLSDLCSNYLEQFLHEYHFNKDRRVFTQIFTASILHTFQQNLRGLLMAAKAYPAALNGDLAAVKKFIKYHSNYKDKSGFWGTTLIWSAARREHFHIVKYLIESAGCCVNAQNQTDLNYALINDNDVARANTAPLAYNPDPKAGSTALHAACFTRNLEIVEYLIKNGADYFLTNQLGETPIQNSKDSLQIQQFFKNYLITSYVNSPDTRLPDATVLNCYDRRPNNCLWEYKSINGLKWEEFTPNIQLTLSTSLMPVTNEEIFNTTIYLSDGKSTYPADVPKFLRGSKNQEPNPSDKDKQAWIRCRGSSIANFDIHCIWQLMFVKYESIQLSSSIPSLDASIIPSIYDSKFEIKLNSWYTCDSQLNDLLDKTMNYRRKCLEINGSYIGQVTCNLYSFTFASDDGKTVGFIRWIPKLIANISKTENSIKELDNFQAIKQYNPIPLTTKRLEQSIQSKSTIDLPSTTSDNNEIDSMDNLSGVEPEIDDDDEDDNIQSIGSTTNDGSWSLTDLINNSSEEQIQQDDKRTTTHDSIDDHVTPSINLVEKITIKKIPEAENLAKQEDAVQQVRVILNTENEQLRTKVSALEKQINEQSTNQHTSQEDNQRILNNTIKSLEDTKKQLQEKLKHEELITNISKQISTLEYDLPKSNHSILSKWSLIFKNLKALNYPHKEYFKDIVPMMDLHDQNDSIIILKGFPIHHRQLEDIMDRLKDLLYRIQSAEELYQQQTNNNKQSVIRIIDQVRSTNAIYWNYYRTSLIKLIRNKSLEYIRQFQNYIQNQLKTFLSRCIENSTSDFPTEIETLTDNYMQKENFASDIDSLKMIALNEFLRDKIFGQQKSSKTVPTKESISTLNKHIDKVKKLLTTTTDYKGWELKKFKMIVPLLQRIMIYYNCFTLQLPLFNASIDLLDRIDKNTVLTIETSTGSGKSTLLPALLVAEGYDKIIVTQPRRLPCSAICARVNSTIIDNISGWAVSGTERNVQAKILYITDGLLKERLMNDENFITKNTTLNKSVVFFIDEVHERSVNIDFCLALFARLLKLNPELKSKMKIIISSATLDASVPSVYKAIPGCSLSEFSLKSLTTLYPVTYNRVPHENILDLVQKLYSKRIRYDQILCFVGSTHDAHENCDLLEKITKGAIVAYPLVQSQSAREQQKYIEQGTVFFSTTVAETSLTFPCLKYVIDTGVINMPIYDLELERSELKEIKAAQSTTKQRLGRLGRTQPGEYYALYDYADNEQKKYPKPQICQSDLVNIEFSLRKCRLRTNLTDFKQYLPNQPEQPYIDNAIQQLKRLELIDSNGQFNKVGLSVAELPDFSSLQMSKAVYYALRKYRCGRDLIILSSILSVLNTSAILKSIPIEYKSPEGDFMTLLNVMNTILVIRDKVPSTEFNLSRVCNAKKLSTSTHIIKKALHRCQNLERALNLSDNFREDALIQSGNWEYIAKALIKGFPDQVFVSLKILQGKAQQFIKYHVDQRILNQQNSDETLPVAIIDRSSTLRTKNKGVLPASLVLARDVRYLAVIRSTSILSFVGKIELTWLEYTFTREIPLNAAEQQTLASKNILQTANQQFSEVQIDLIKHSSNAKLVIKGPSGKVLKAELYIRQQLVTKLSFPLSSDQKNDNLTRNLRSITNMPLDLFGPLRWRWEAEQQVKVRTKMNAKQGTIDVTVEGLDSQNQAVQNEFMSFLYWLSRCAVIRNPHSGVAPRVLKPALRSEFRDMEGRISNITDPDRTSVDRWKNLKGPAATRETRMEVVAWIAVCLFDCRLEGGFVRDWVVNKESKPSNLPINQWVIFDPKNGLPVLNKDLVPSDLDIHLPVLKQFDVEAFVDTLYGYGITAQIYRQPWRYVLLIDEKYKTGPFTIDLIEPHVALTHDLIDFDVSNLSLEKLYTRDLGMRVDITNGTHPIQLETIVENIRKKQFQVLRPIDEDDGSSKFVTVAQRIEKMVARGWTQIGEPWSFIPNPPTDCNAILVPYPKTTVLHQNIVTAIEKIGGARVLSIEQIKNADIESLYENMKKNIVRECPNDDPNERELFHGTSGKAIEGIINRGYDDRHFSPDGAWGRGAYFADDPRKSNGYALPDPTTTHRVIFYNKVLLGVESKQSTTDNTLTAAPENHHSVHGTGGWQGFLYHEYIVYRYGQALPYLKITYKIT